MSCPNADFGPCCACQGTVAVRTLYMLPFRGPSPGKGWGCLVCGLPSDGAMAVLCDACLEARREPSEVILGWVAQKGRAPITAEMRAQRFEHDMSRHLGEG